MTRGWGRIALVAVLFALLAAGARAQEAEPVPAYQSNFLAADITHPGVVSLFFFGAEGTRVTFFEEVGGREQPLGTRTAPAGEPTIFKNATPWSCERLVRSFSATATLPSGTIATGSYQVRTPSCAQRFDLDAPRRVTPGAKARIRVVDKWGIGGVRPKLCITPPSARRSCKELKFPRAVAYATRRFHAEKAGRWRVELRIRSFKVRSSVAVGRNAGPLEEPPPVLLATGDSTMQGIDSFLGDELGDDYDLRSDVRPGTGISKGSGWQRLSRSQARRVKPAATVISVGAVDGAPMTLADGTTSVVCCDEPWIAEYSRRVREQMRAYRRHGKAKVFWMTLPMPKGPTFVAEAINTAILRAAEGMDGVVIPRMDLLFTPHGFTDVMQYGGREVRVRADDGIHLNVSGTAIAAKAIARVIRES